MIRAALIFWVCFYCLRRGCAPWKFFQLNARWFDEGAGMYSKLAINRLAPERWRLPEQRLHEAESWARFPLFIKPEWGQNSHGIFKVNSAHELEAVRERVPAAIPYLAQEAAPGSEEYEIFFVRSPKNSDAYSILSLTRTHNRTTDPYPINGVLNPECKYDDITGSLSDAQLAQLWTNVLQLPAYVISRVSCRCDSLDALLAGDFHIIEVNLFVPMPLCLKDERWRNSEKNQFIRKLCRLLAQHVGQLPRGAAQKPVFTSHWAWHRKLLS